MSFAKRGVYQGVQTKNCHIRVDRLSSHRRLFDVDDRVPAGGPDAQRRCHAENNHQ